MVEFYTVPGQDEMISKLLKNMNFTSIFIAIPALKSAGYSLCATEETERNQAMKILMKCLDRAAVIGCRTVMINSGFLPKKNSLIKDACQNYIKSVDEAYTYIASKGYKIEISLEPGDSCIQSFQLLGPTDRVIKTTKEILFHNPGYKLTMDVAHLREEGEDVLESLTKTLPYCTHIHLCNCLMNDPSHPLYGDKHVDFDYPGACYGYQDFEIMYRKLRSLYDQRYFIITLESLCRSENNESWFDNIIKNTTWLFD
jgi:sugar phosphate isomerase/epimerase